MIVIYFDEFSDGQRIYGRYEISDNSQTINQVNGLCGDGKSDQYIMIHWTESGRNNLMNLTFHRNQKSHDYSLNRIDFNLTAKLLPNGSDEMLIFHHSGENFFEIPVGMAYRCFRGDKFVLKSSEYSNHSIGTISFPRIMADAYRTTKLQQFSTAIDCRVVGTPSEF